MKLFYIVVTVLNNVFSVGRILKRWWMDHTANATTSPVIVTTGNSAPGLTTESVSAVSPMNCPKMLLFVLIHTFISCPAPLSPLCF